MKFFLVVALATSLTVNVLAAETDSAEQLPLQIVIHDVDTESRANPCREIEFLMLDEAWVKRMGLRYTCHPYPWKRAQRMVEEHHHDGMVTTMNAERAQYTVASSVPVYTSQMLLTVSRTHPQLQRFRLVKTPADLRGLTAVVYLGDGWAKNNLTPLNIAIDWAPNTSSALKKVAQQRGDFYISDDMSLIQQSIDTLLLSNELIVLPQSLQTTEFPLLLNKDSIYVKQLPLLDKTLRQMRADGTSKRIYDTYLAGKPRQ